MLQRVIEYIDRYSMLQNGDKVIIALSGGPDSICLAHILNRLGDKYGIKLYAAHVNHCLRGHEADEDENYAKSFCDKNGIEFFSRKIDIKVMAKERNLSSETAGREARYSYFNELKDILGANKIALAHNLNDQAETILMRVMRGTGLEGLHGIKPVRDGVYIRPVLGLNRSEIEDYCDENNLKPRLDKTNLENIYNRNKVRLELIPYIQENFNKDIVNTLSRLSYIISRDNEFIEKFAQKKYNQYCNREKNILKVNPTLMEEDEAVISRVVRKAIGEIKGNLRDIEMVHIYDTIALFSLGTGKKISIPGNIAAENVYGFLHIYDNDKKLEDQKTKGEIILFEKLQTKLPVNAALEHMELNVNIRLVGNQEKVKFGENALKKYFDYDKIKEKVSIRYRVEGDRFVPYGMTGNKKLKDLFIDLKIPKSERDNIPLICFDEQIAWVVGFRVSNEFSITKNTKNILEIKIEKGEN